MKKKTVIIMLLIPVILAQLAVPMFLIHEKNDVIRNGSQYKFRISAWVVGNTISFDLNDSNNTMFGGPGKYGKIAVADDGFAYISEVTAEKPAGDYVVSENDGYFYFPLSEYSLNEKAYDAVFKKLSNYGTDCYITVRVKNSRIYLENLFVDGMTVEQYVAGN